jgi:ATP-dependent RNA helicase DeaD
MNQQLKELETDRRIIVGTPGRVLDHMQQRTILLRKCQYFVLDEADEMLSMDFLEPITEILRRLPAQRQGLFVSATITPRVESLASSFLRNPRQIVIDTPGEEQPQIRHRYCEVSGELTAKMTALCDILEVENPTSAIIFCNTKSDTELVEKFLRRRGFDARCINSDLNQKQRDYVMAKIRARELRYLVGTDIAARGIDIAQIDLVVNYALPQDSESYVHRTGRTGRAGRSGEAISLVGPQDFMAFTNLKRTVSVALEQFPAPSETEVLEARVGRFLTLLEKEGVDVHGRDVVLAEEILRRHGLENPSIDISTLVGKLCRVTLDHAMKFESQSLDEEMAGLSGAPRSPESAERREDRPSRGEGRSSDRRRRRSGRR